MHENGMTADAWRCVTWLDPPNRWQRSSTFIITDQDFLVFEFMDAPQRSSAFPQIRRVPGDPGIED
jgi:hypothetical protein